MSRREDSFMIPEVQMEFRPKKQHKHLAREFQETSRPEVASEITRGLMPWAREVAIYGRK